MRAFFSFLLLGAVLIFQSCQSPKEKNIITVSLIHINDVYEIAAVNKGQEGGFARLAYLVDSLKKDNPNTLVVHAGDFLSPSLIGNLRDESGQKIKGKQMVEVMNASNVDVVTFGNHEFDIKEGELLKRINESKFEWISSNVFHRIDSSRTEPFVQNGKDIQNTFQRVFVQNGDSFKLGLVGVTLPFNKKKHVSYTDVLETLEAVLDTISTDQNVLLTHLEREQDQEVARNFTEVPLIMGGHDHYHFMDTIGKVYVAKADANLRTVWKHDLTYDFVTKTMTVSSELIKLDNSIEEKESVLTLVNEWNDFAKKKSFEMGFELDRVIWEGDSVWECRETIIRAQQTNFGNLVASSMTALSKSEISLLNSGSLRYDDQIQKVITSGDILKALPFGGQISVARIPGKELEEIIKIGLVKNKGMGGYLQIPDVTLINDVVRFKGEELDLTKEYKVCTSTFMSQGKETNLGMLKQYDWQPVISKSNVANDIRNIIIWYLVNGDLKE